jgi:acyl-CoA reductase-like NAD-dependent aldehyde dehydrogenase
MDVDSEESFGPVLSVIRARDADQAVKVANSSQYGLSSSVWSKDIMAALQVAKGLECSAVHINSTTVYGSSFLADEQRVGINADPAFSSAFQTR